jgi:hypothetical protein
MSRQPRQNPFPAVIFVFAITTFIVVMAYRMSQPHGGGVKAAAPSKSKDFWASLEERKPVFDLEKYPCPVCLTELNVPFKTRDHSNLFGGVGTDMMGVALRPNPAGSGPPDVDCQDYDHLLVGCPECGAFYGGMDVVNFNGGNPFNSLVNLRANWTAKSVPPELVGRPFDELTYDERGLIRYLTTKTACEGDSSYDLQLGFVALDAAFGANVSVYIGRDYKIPSTAFYALTEAHFRAALDKDPDFYETNGRAAMTLIINVAECNRLLGRAEASKAAFIEARSRAEAEVSKREKAAAEAKEGGKPQAIYDSDFLLKEAKTRLSAVDQIEAYLKKGDFDLHRYKVKGEKKPPIGWYIEQMLPGINGEIQATRAQWAGLSDPDEIVAAMLARLAGSPGSGGDGPPTEAPGESTK